MLAGEATQLIAKVRCHCSQCKGQRQWLSPQWTIAKVVPCLVLIVCWGSLPHLLPAPGQGQAQYTLRTPIKILESAVANDPRLRDPLFLYLQKQIDSVEKSRNGILVFLLIVAGIAIAALVLSIILISDK